MEIGLLDLKCILIERGIFKCKVNGVETLLTQEVLWGLIHEKKLLKAEIINAEQTLVYILLENTEIVLEK